MVSQLLSSISSDRYLLGFVIAAVAIVAYKKLVPHRLARRKAESSHSVPSSPIDEKQDRPFGGWVPQQFDYPTITPYSEDPLQLKPIPYRPFKWGDYHVTMGIRSMPWDDWIELDSQFTHYARIRETRMKARGERVLRILPARPGVASGASAAIELVYELAEYLHRRYPSVYSITRHSSEKSTYGWYKAGDIKTITVVPLNRTFNLDEEKPLEVATMLVQEDLAIMIEGEDGRYYFQAGTIVNSGTWRLEDKIGMPLEEIHISGDVPRYRSKLELSMGRFFHRMPLDKPVIRNNYSFQVVRPPSSPSSSCNPDRTSPSSYTTNLDPSELGWAVTMKGDENLVASEGNRWLRDINGALTEVTEFTQTPEDSPKPKEVTPDMVWMRTERQTLRRLPKTGAIVFTIRVYQTPVIELVKEPGVPGRMASAIRSWPEDVAAYKAKNAFEGILDYLDEYHAKQVSGGSDIKAATKPFPL